MRYLIELRIEVVRFKEDWKKFSGGKLTKFPDCRGEKNASGLRLMTCV